MGKQEKGSHNPREILHILPISPATLGWVPSTPRLTTLMKSSLDLRTMKQSNGEQIYFCRFPPVRGPQFLGLLTAATPRPAASLGREVELGVIADWSMPKLAKRDEENKRLNNIHKSDPVIDQAMQAFTNDYLERWIAVLQSYEPTNAINIAEAVMVADMHDFSEAFWQKAWQDFGQNHTSTSEYIGVSETSLQIFNNFIDEELGQLFSPTDQEHLRFRKELEMEAVWRNRFNNNIGILMQGTILEKYVAWLQRHPQDRKQTAEEFLLKRDKKILIDVDSSNEQNCTITLPEVFKTDAYSDLVVRYVNGHVIVVDSGAEVTRQFSKNNDHSQPFNLVTETIFLAPITTVSIVDPVVAWRKSKSGERVFLERSEMKNIFAEQYEPTWDDWVGIAALTAVQSRLRAKRVPERMHLKDERREVRKEGGNAIGPAQIGVLVNRPQFRAWMAEDPDGVFASIEAYVGKVT